MFCSPLGETDARSMFRCGFTLNRLSSSDVLVSDSSLGGLRSILFLRLTVPLTLLLTLIYVVSGVVNFFFLYPMELLTHVFFTLREGSVILASCHGKTTVLFTCWSLRLILRSRSAKASALNFVLG